MTEPAEFSGERTRPRVRSPDLMKTGWNRKDLLGIRELSAEEIVFLLDTAERVRRPAADMPVGEQIPAPLRTPVSRR